LLTKIIFLAKKRKLSREGGTRRKRERERKRRLKKMAKFGST